MSRFFLWSFIFTICCCVNGITGTSDLIFLPLKKMRVIRIRAMSIPAILHSFLKNMKK